MEWRGHIVPGGAMVLPAPALRVSTVRSSGQPGKADMGGNKDAYAPDTTQQYGKQRTPTKAEENSTLGVASLLAAAFGFTLPHAAAAAQGAKHSSAAPTTAAKVKVQPAVPTPIPQRNRPACPSTVSPEDSKAEHASADVAQPTYTVGQVLQRFKSLLAPTNPHEHQLYSDCYAACDAVRDAQTQACDIAEVALRLRALGWHVVVRRVVDSKTYWTKSMTNMFCYCVLPVPSSHGQPQQQGYVIDPNFKEMFRTAHMTDRYRDIWECLPPLFVGQAAQLVPLIQLLCYEVTLSFEAVSRQLPPWRSYSATVGRWLSTSFTDVPVPSLCSSHETAWRAQAEVVAFVQHCQQLLSAQLEEQAAPAAPATAHARSAAAAAPAQQQKVQQQQEAMQLSSQHPTVHAPISCTQGFPESALPQQQQQPADPQHAGLVCKMPCSSSMPCSSTNPSTQQQQQGDASASSCESAPSQQQPQQAKPAKPRSLLSATLAASSTHRRQQSAAVVMAPQLQQHMPQVTTVRGFAQPR